MPNLIHSLHNRDLGHLRIVAELWGLELTCAETEAALKELAAALLNPELVGEIVETLPPQARSALAALAEAGGKISWASFARQFGEIRETGPGRRDREQVYLHPVSAAEILFYRAILARAFFDTPSGAQEFAYIPDDLLNLFKFKHEGHKEKNFESFVSVAIKESEPLGRPATPKERAHPLPASDRLLDDATTLLAALRLGLQPPETHTPVSVVEEFLKATKIIVPSLPRSPTGMPGEGAMDEVPQPEAVKSFLQIPRREALAMLVEAWQKSETFNELHLIPGLVCEGEWSNQPLVTREFLLDLISAIPQGQWWNLPAFIRAVKEKYPDFQRPAGDYDSWFIRRASDSLYLRGFESWDEVDGALIFYLIAGPMHWLSLVDLAAPDDTSSPTAFRIMSNVKFQTPNVQRLTPDENGKLHVSSQGRITIPRLVPRAARYQIARFCVWEEEKPDEYRYRVTIPSLKKAKEQGLKIEQLLALLQKNAAAPIPPPFVRALQRWKLNGTEARMENLAILRVSRPEVLNELRQSKAGRFLGEPLGPTAIIVKDNAQSKVGAALAELGLLADIE